MEKVKIIECPRDAMQGIKTFIPTSKKVEYINRLLAAGFDTIDFGSFVSPHMIPQLADTALVISQLDWSHEKSKLLAIIANARGAREASVFDQITYLGFPFSISETFQQRNTNASIEEAVKRVEEIQTICTNRNKQLVIFISMAYGNPYDDPWSSDIVLHWTNKLAGMDIKIISLADTTGVAEPDVISLLFRETITAYPDIEFGAHFHTTTNTWREKVNGAYMNGCRRFDGAIKGYGGCPMAKDELTGNMPTENLISYLEEKGVGSEIDKTAFDMAMLYSESVFA
ncbi:MAG: hydroxymethylglutaryl-CoA lyase [Chitinophagales bacterium]|nr:hydroxymethylglutaryl-CoA lyase [Chitinophagales bacterium]